MCPFLFQLLIGNLTQNVYSGKVCNANNEVIVTNVAN